MVQRWSNANIPLLISPGFKDSEKAESLGTVPWGTRNAGQGGGREAGIAHFQPAGMGRKSDVTSADLSLVLCVCFHLSAISEPAVALGDSPGP